MSKKVSAMLIVFLAASGLMAQDKEKSKKEDGSGVDTANAVWVPGNGIQFKSNDGRFGLATRLRAQFLYEYEHINDEVPEGELSDLQAFQIRRARLQFKGNWWGKNNKFKAEFAYSPRDVSREDDGGSNNMKNSPLLDWYLDFTQLRDASLRVGQYKVPFTRERVISSGNLQMVDRSIVNSDFTLDRDLGFDFRSKDLFGLDMFKYYAGVYIGEGRNTSNKTVGAGDMGLMYLARVEFLPFGKFDDYSYGDFARTKKLKMSIGAAYGYVQNAPATGGILGDTLTEELDTQHMSADIFIKWYGFNYHTEFINRKIVDDPTGLNGWGIFFQGGYMLPKTDLEFGFRYGMNRSSDVNKSTQEELNEIGPVVGYYVGKHNLKVQADLMRLYAPDGFDIGEDRFRIQLQAAF